MPRFSGQALKERRILANVSREAVAVAVNRGVDTIRAYELGRACPSADMVGGLAEVLGVEVADLFEPTDGERLADQAVEQGHARHVGDQAVLRRVAALVRTGGDAA